VIIKWTLGFGAISFTYPSFFVSSCENNRLFYRRVGSFSPLVSAGKNKKPIGFCLI